MPIYSSLSQVRANQILTLADQSFAAHMADAPEGGLEYGSTEALERMFREPAAERKALLNALDELSHPEALDLIAIMYVGRGDYIEDSHDVVQVKAAFNIQSRDFQGREVSELVSICAEKDLAFHEYLRRGLDLLK